MGRCQWFGHACGVRVDGPPARGLWPPDGGGLCSLRSGGNSACGADFIRIALRAILIKSALRIYLSVSYVMIGILLIGSLRSPPPIRAAPDCPLFRGQNKTPRSIPFISRSQHSGALLSHRFAGGRWCRKAPKGDAFPRPQGGCIVLYKLAPSINLKAPSTAVAP